jgi:hypothetical protein
MAVSDRSKIIYLLILIVFLAGLGIFWLDYINLINISNYTRAFKGEPGLVVDASGDEPSLVEKEEFEKEKDKILERIEELDKREALLLKEKKNLSLKKINLTR